MRINILDNKNRYIKVISLMNKFNKTLFYIIINKIIYNLILKLCKIL